jgi:hypothetical protein
MSRRRTATGTAGMDTEALAAAQSQLMQLIPLFEETKQYLKKVDTADRSTPRVGASAGGGSGDDELRAQLEEAEQDIRLMTATMQQLQAENARLRQQAQVSDARRAAAANMVSAMVELRMSLRGMGNATEAWLALADEEGAAPAPVAAPLPPGLRDGPAAPPSSAAPPAPAAPPPMPPAAAPAASGLDDADARGAIKEMVPLFPETQQYLKKVEVDDRSGPKLDAVTPDKSAPGPQEIMQLVPLFAETKQYLKKVETVDKSKPAIPAGAGAVSDAHKGKAGSLGERAPPIKPRASKQEKTLSIAERRKQLVALRQTVEATQFDM